MNSVTILSSPREIKRTAWEKLLRESENRSPFQGPKYFDFYAGLSDYQPFVFAAESNGSIIVLISGVIIAEKTMLKRFFSRRAIIFGGPLLQNQSPETLIALDKTLKAMDSFLKDKILYAEMRNLSDYSSCESIFKKNFWHLNPHLNFLVEIDKSSDACLKKLSKSKRRQVSKSFKNGAEIVLASTLEEVDEFYLLLQKLYQSKVGKPLPSIQFFRNFFRHELGIFLLVKKDTKIVAGMTAPILDGERIYEWYIAGSDLDYREIYPSVIATWAAIQYASDNGLAIFDFMGAGKPNEDYGVREFKEKFGGKLVSFGRYKKIYKPYLYRVGEIGLSIYRKLI
jgi:serine/alanine adding enzyme